MPITHGWMEVNYGGRENYKKRSRERQLHEEYQHQKNMENMERMKDEIEEDIQLSGDDNDDPTHHRLGGGQSCGMTGDHTLEYAIDGEISSSWNQGKFCEHFTRLNYNLDVMKFMDDESMTGDFTLDMRITNIGRAQVMCVTHLYLA